MYIFCGLSMLLCSLNLSALERVSLSKDGGPIGTIQLHVATPPQTDSVKVYDGSDTCILTILPTLDSVRAGEDVVLHVSANYTSKNAGCSMVVVNYSISGANALGYYSPKADTILYSRIVPKGISVQGIGVSTSKIYDGTCLASVLNQGSLSGVVSNDVVQHSLFAIYDDSRVGDARTIKVFGALTGADAANYWLDTVTYGASISPKHIGVENESFEKLKMYDATASSTVMSMGNLVGVVAGDDVSHTLSSHFSSSQVGTNRSIIVSGELSGLDAANYILDTMIFNDGVITPRLLTLDTVNFKDKIYDGTELAEVDTIHFSGVIEGEICLLDSSIGVARFYDKNVGVNKPVYLIPSLMGADAGNYSLVVNGAANIEPIYAVIDGLVVDTIKEYDGTFGATVSVEPWIENMIQGDDIALLVSAYFGDSVPGENLMVMVSYQLSGIDAPNYLIDTNSVVYSANGKIVSSMVFDLTGGSPVHSADDGYCHGANALLKVNMTQGAPKQWQLIFDEEGLANGFVNTGWQDMISDTAIRVAIPSNCKEGDYWVGMQFRSEAGVESAVMTDTIRVNYSEDLLVQLFEDVICLSNVGGRFDNLTIQWYKDDVAEPIGTGLYYREKSGKLNGDYYAKIVNNNVTVRTCAKSFGDGGQMAKKMLTVSPNPVSDRAIIKLVGFENQYHVMKVMNQNGVVYISDSFMGDSYSIQLNGCPQGMYLIVVDGEVQKIVKM